MSLTVRVLGLVVVALLIAVGLAVAAAFLPLLIGLGVTAAFGVVSARQAEPRMTTSGFADNPARLAMGVAGGTATPRSG